MDIFLVPVILLGVMYATVRSLSAGLFLSAILAGIAAWLTRGGAPASIWNAIGMVSSGLILGTAGRGRARPERTLIAATAPLAAALAYGALTLAIALGAALLLVRLRINATWLVLAGALLGWGSRALGVTG